MYTGHGIESQQDKFIAIAEGTEMPLYALTYGIEMVQLYFDDPSATLDNFNLDHSIIARKQFMRISSDTKSCPLFLTTLAFNNMLKTRYPPAWPIMTSISFTDTF